jgi:type III secretion protein C
MFSHREIAATFRCAAIEPDVNTVPQTTMSSIHLLQVARKVALVLAMAAATCAQAAEPVWGSKNFAYRAEGKRLPDVIRDFGAAVGVPVMVEPGVEGTVNGSFNSTPSAFLSAITRAYGVVWYFDGATLIAYPANSVKSRIFPMRGLTRAQVRQMLATLGLGDSRFPLRFNEAQDTLVASGPSRHIEIVESVLDALSMRHGIDRGPVVAVLPLKYAYASDRVLGNLRLPGLVSTLNGIYAGRAADGGGTHAADTRAHSARHEQPLGAKAQERSALENFGLKPAEPNAERSAPPRARDAAGDASEAAARARSASADTPTFFADEATNSVIVRAKADRMAEHEALVRSLDVAQDLVEMEVTIIDVSSDEFDALGIQWGFSNSRGTTNVASSVDGVVNPNITTLITDAGRELLSRIRLLEGNGKANILSRPKLLGAANRMATMVDKRVASVRVAGNLDANLFSIEAGTTVQFQPQIVGGGDRKRDVRLTLYISDGNFEGQLVDQVPIIKRTEIQTDATIPEGESLLIGGISVQSTTQSTTAVPGISRLPLFGALFRSNEAKKAKSERLFLLTPKIIRVSGSDSARADIAPGAASQPKPDAAKGVPTEPDTAPALPAPTVPKTLPPWER